MKVKVAVASSDGIVVNSHFGHARQFLIFELGEQEQCLLELRENLPGCSNLKEPAGTMEETIENIADCDYVLVSKIGKPMIQRLLEKGVEAYAMPNMIEDSLATLRSLIFN